MSESKGVCVFMGERDSEKRERLCVCVYGRERQCEERGKERL